MTDSTDKLAELRSERVALAATQTKEALVHAIDEWLTAARAQAAGSSRLTLSGQASGEHLWQVLAELQLDDAEIAGRIVAKLEGLGFGAISERQRDSQLKKLDGQIAVAEKENLAARKAEAIAAIERQYAGVSEAEFSGEAA